MRNGTGRPRRERASLLQPLEDRRLLSTSYPLSQSAWTMLGPAPLYADATAGRVTGIATDPSVAGRAYVATASGGVFRTDDAGAHWQPLTDAADTLFMGAIAISPSNPDVLYAGTGEANWGPSKIVKKRDNIYYGLGVLKSSDGGDTWTMLGQAEFYRRSISRIVVHPSNPDVVYAAVGFAGNNGLSGNTGIWKSSDGGATWTNITASISTTAAFTDLVMDPNNPRVLYAGVGDHDGDAANGIYKSTDGGTTWLPMATMPFQNHANLGRVTLAIAPSAPQTVYAMLATVSLSATNIQELAFVRTADAGATWQSGALPNVGGATDYNICLVVHPTQSNWVFIGGKANGTELKRSSNGGTSWSTMPTGGSYPHVDHHAFAFDAAGNLWNGNDGGVWSLSNPTGAGTWTSRNGDMASLQIVGLGLHPTNSDVAWAGFQDNGTNKFNDNRVWSFSRGGDGGVVRVDQDNPNTVYTQYYYSGSGFLGRSDNGGSSYVGKTSGIATSTDPAYFYPPYVMDPVNSSRLVLGTNRVYETNNRGDSWSPISLPNANGWNTNAVIDALAIAKTDGNVVYASAGGKVFVTLNKGATWLDRSVNSGFGDHFVDITVDPRDASVAYLVRDRFDGGHVFRTADAGATWTDITGDLPNLPAQSVELDVRGPARGDDVLYVGTDAGLYQRVGQSLSWTKVATGLPNVQIREIEYQPRLGILAVGTHGRGMWQLAVPDLAAPVTTAAEFAFETAPHLLRFTFSERVQASLTAADVSVVNLDNSVPLTGLTLTYDRRLDRATIGFTGLSGGVLPDGNYRATVAAAGVTDAAGNLLAGDGVLDFFVFAGDANRDRSVNIADFSTLATNFNSAGTYSLGDFNYSGQVEIGDFSILASKFNTSLPAPARAVAPSLVAGPVAPSPAGVAKRFADRPIELLQI